MKLICYNIFIRNKILFPKENQKKRIRRIAKEMKRLKPDVVCFQELFSYRDLADKVMKKAGYKHHTGNYRVGLRINGGIRTYSRHKIKKEKFNMFKVAHGEDDFATKGIMLTKIIVDNVSYNIVNIHLQSGRKAEKMVAKFKQIEQLGKFISKLNGNIILCGDFNLDFLTQRDLHNNLTAIVGLDYIPTSNMELVEHKLLDHIFTNMDMELSSQIIKMPHSDHNPLVLEF